MAGISESPSPDSLAAALREMAHDRFGPHIPQHREALRAAASLLESQARRLAEVEADGRRLDWLHEHDCWKVEKGREVWTARIETGLPLDDTLSDPPDVREVIDRAMLQESHERSR